MKQILLLAALAAAAVMWLAEIDRSARLRQQNASLAVQLAHARIPFRSDTIRESILVVTQTVVEVPPSEMKQALASQRQTIRDLHLRIGQLEAALTTARTIADSVPARHDPSDSSFRYSDQWADISLRLADTTFRYTIRDSLAAYVYREYRHRFLWWRWGTKGYQLKLVNFNPHARITYNSYVKAGR